MSLPRFKLAPVALATALAVATMAASPTVLAQSAPAAAEATYNINLPAQPLGNALNELARQAGLQLLVRRELVEGKQAPAVRGSMTGAQALQRLLAGSGLSATTSGASVVVREAPAPRTAEATLPAVTVTADSADDPTTNVSNGLMAVRPSAGLSRMPLTIREQAQTIQIVPRESIEDRNVLSIHEAVETIAGVRAVSPAYASRSVGIRSRGFTSSDSYINGVRVSGFGVPLDTANVESVEVVKGPAGVQFGLAEPGGALNIVTKRPVAERIASAKVTLGSFETRRLDVDLGGAVGSDRKVLTRLNLSAEDNEEHRDFDESRRVSIAPSITWLVSDRTTVGLDLAYLHNTYRFNRGLPPQDFILGLPFKFSTVEPNQPLSRNEATNLLYTLQHRLGDGAWTLRQRAGINRTSSKSSEINFGVSNIDATGNLNRIFYSSYQEEYSWVVQHEILGAFELGGLKHKAMFGFEFGNQGREYGFREPINATRNPPPLNVFNPVYGGYAPPSEAELQDSYPPETYGNRFHALYADWHTTFSPTWRALFGLRLDRTEGYYKSADGTTDYGAGESKGVSPRLGLVWTPMQQTDVFANYSTGFSPNLFADSAGNIFNTPEKSRQFEVGVRHEIIPDRLRATASVFSITKRNVQTADPSDPTGNRSVLAGEQRSDGFEFELAGAISRAWSVTLGYAYTDARTTKENNASQVGLPLVDAPKHHVTLWTKYRLQGLPGWWVGYGLAHASDRRSSSANAAFRLPSYVRHDLAIGFADGPWSYQLNLGNVSNERVYYTHSNNIHLQPERNARVSVSYKF